MSQKKNEHKVRVYVFRLGEELRELVTRGPVDVMSARTIMIWATGKDPLLTGCFGTHDPNDPTSAYIGQHYVLDNRNIWCRE